VSHGFLLDTNVVSEPRKPRPEPKVDQWLGRTEENSLHLSVITLGELRDGCERLEPGKRRDALDAWLEREFRAKFDDRILPVTDAVADRWGRIRARREKLGMRIHTQDGLIAATALEHNLTLVTRNVWDFRELGLDIINPWDV